MGINPGGESHDAFEEPRECDAVVRGHLVETYGKQQVTRKQQVSSAALTSKVIMAMSRLWGAK